MNMKHFSLGTAVAGLLAVAAPAHAQSTMAGSYAGGTDFSQQNVLPGEPGIYIASPQGIRQQEVEAAETNISIGTGFTYTKYKENLTPGDSEDGVTPGLQLGASVLLPGMLIIPHADLYAALSYNLNAGYLNYTGHYLFSGAPVNGTDHAVFNRIEGRFGMGFPVGNFELIPFLAAGYQAWNRDVYINGNNDGSELYSSALAGAGFKADLPLSRRLVASATTEAMAMLGNHITSNTVGFGSDLGNSGTERVTLGLDDAIHDRFHLITSVFGEHFNYAGSKPTASSGYYYEPLSTTWQFGANIGVAYSF